MPRPPSGDRPSVPWRLAGCAQLRPVEPHYARFSEAFRAAVDGCLRQRTPLPADLQAQLSDALQGRLAPADGG